MRRIVTLACCATAAGFLAGCSSSQTLVNHPSGSSNVAHVGDTLDLHTANGRPFSATLTKVTDPAQGKGQAPKSGKRFVTTAFDIHNTSSDTLHADLNADVTATGTNGHLYTVSSVANSACGGLTTGQFQVPVGKSASVCTGFELKDAVNVTKVQLSPAAGTASDYGEWLNP